MNNCFSLQAQNHPLTKYFTLMRVKRGNRIRRIIRRRMMIWKFSIMPFSPFLRFSRLNRKKESFFCSSDVLSIEMENDSRIEVDYNVNFQLNSFIRLFLLLSCLLTVKTKKDCLHKKLNLWQHYSDSFCFYKFFFKEIRVNVTVCGLRLFMRNMRSDGYKL